MSIESITTVAIARNRRPPTKNDAGTVTPDSVDQAKTATTVELLAKSVPVGLLALYTTFVAVVTQVIPEPTKADLTPELYLPYRWAAFAVLVVAAGALTYISYRNKGGAHEVRRVPLVEMGAVMVATAGYGLGIPESPLLAAIEDAALGLVVIALIVFVAGVTNLVLASMMKSQAGGAGGTGAVSNIATPPGGTPAAQPPSGTTFG